VGLKVFVVDDDKSMVDIICHHVSSLGCNVVGTASSRIEAVEKVGQSEPNVVLMDIKLGGAIDGIEAAREILERYSTHVIYLTAYADDAIMVAAEKTLPYGYIVKPFSRDEIDRALKIANNMIRFEQRIKDEQRKAQEDMRKLEVYRRKVLENHLQSIDEKKLASADAIRRHFIKQT